MVQWIQPGAERAFTGLDAEPDYAINAFFPVARGFKAQAEAISYTIKFAVWDEGGRRLLVISSHASRQGDRPGKGRPQGTHADAYQCRQHAQATCGLSDPSA
jgi:hypothetical protein